MGLTEGEEEELDSIISLCGCGDPEQAESLLARVLGAFTTIEGPRIDYKDDSCVLINYLLDALGLTEHGTSINWAWLSPNGKRALVLLSKKEKENPDAR